MDVHRSFALQGLKGYLSTFARVKFIKKGIVFTSFFFTLVKYREPIARTE